MTNQEAFQYAVDTLIPLMGNEEAKANIYYLFYEQYDLTKTILLTHDSDPFAHQNHLESSLERLKKHEPLQYILGYAYFDQLKINVNSSVLIPRPETEELVDIAKKYIINEKQIIADICTGSGCIALTMRLYFPSNKIIATDVSEKAIETAKGNELNIFNSKSIQFEIQDILKQEWLFQIPDIVICNPPYIEHSESIDMAPHVMEYEPHLALFVYHHDPLLFYKSIIQTFLPHPFPIIFFEMNPHHTEAFKNYCQLHQLNCETVSDMQGKERFAIISKS